MRATPKKGQINFWPAISTEFYHGFEFTCLTASSQHGGCLKSDASESELLKAGGGTWHFGKTDIYMGNR